MATNYKPLEDYLGMAWSFNVQRMEDTEEPYFFVQVNELPGCMTDGATIEEAFGNVYEAIESWILATMEAGNPIPEPLNVDDYKGNITYRTSSKKHYMLAREAQRLGISINKLIEQAVDDKLVG